MAVLSDYVSGTITLTNGSDAFTGSGTAWQLAQIGEGDAIFYLPGTAFEGVISTITSNVAGTLQRPWEGPDLSNVAYRIRIKPDGSRSTAQSAMLRETLGNGNNLALAGINGVDGLIPIFTGPGAMTGVPRSEFINGARFDVQVDTLADRATYDAQPAGYAVLVADIGDGRSALYSKASNTSGDWSAPAFITGPEGAASTVPGVVWRGVYDAGTAYAINDGVRFNGSSFRKLTTSAAGTAPSAASPPVDNANWAVLAAKGADGLGTGDVVGPASATDMSIAGFDGATGKLIRELTSAQATSYLALFTTAKGLVPGAASGDVAANRLLRADGTWVDPPSTSGDLEFVLAQVLMKLSDLDNQAQFLGPSGNRFADSFDTLTYVDVAGATNLDTSAAGVLKPTNTPGSQQIPLMTSATTSGVTMSASSTFPGSYEAWRAGDRNTGTFWSSASPSSLPHWIKVDFGTARSIGSYTLQSRGDGGRGTDIVAFALEGSNDDSAWSAVDTRSSLTWTNGEIKTFTPTTVAPYRYYRVNITSTTTPTGGAVITEMTMTTVGVFNNATVRSAALSAASAPAQMKAMLNVREVTAAVAGTDYTLECSRDNGTTWTAMTLNERYTMPTSGLRVVEADQTSVSGQPSGTAPRWRFRTLNNVNVELHDIYLYWS